MATIVIDPGHTGSYNPGVCIGYYEGNTMLKLAQFLGTALNALGAAVRYTRTDNSQNPTLTERGRMAAGADLFISLHSDASDNPLTRGVTSYNSVQRPMSVPFADAIGEAAAGAMGNQFRGTIARPSETTPGVDFYGVLRAAEATGVLHAFLIEHGFHTNQQDCELLSNPDVLTRIAQAEAEVIVYELDLSQSDGCGFVYTVQPGENLYSISVKLGISWQEIAYVNGIVEPYFVMSGQELLIPQACR